MFKKIIREILNFARIAQLNIFKKCKINYSAKIYGSSFSSNNNICRQAVIRDCYIGDYSYFGTNTRFVKTSIGRFCSIANNVTLIIASHPIDFVSTSPYFYNTVNKSITPFCRNDYEEFRYSSNEKKYLCEIGNDVWIGENAHIMQGIKIGNGAIVGAGALVTKDVPPYAIVGGVPAKVIKKRFDNKVIAQLEAARWWDYDIPWIKENSGRFNDVESFLRYLNKYTS